MIRTIVRRFALGAAVAAIATGAFAEEAPRPRKLELARRYVAAAQMDKTFDAILTAMKPAMESRLPAGKLTPEQQKKLMALVDDISRQAMRKVIDKMPPLMAEVFTEDELRGMVEFYEGPVGRSLIAKTPELAQKMAPLNKELILDMQQQMLSRLCEVADCTETPPKAQPS